ncbi:Stk1 family PASTA domain-containing Ser/Thr kinase [Tepidanaerobacter acetatoxydans]|uniref:Stk1 family PASTA domain-containing Ser/Thr kinase n=1 Tax=Tepidanaerobacter acetatoxydans TaxID=499229 RepID=UPI001BD1CFB4|nr:Stk1 family PASTA domain-containing Ser/Thr kinase [Tepidanaerobacter acetatoxydans]
MIGKTLGNRYIILEEISGGGMAVVYKARCNLLNRVVAIKVLKQDFAEDEDFVRRFRREAQAAASLSHPNIVGIYDVGEEDGLYYIVMEYVEGITLKQFIKQNAPIPPAEVVEMGIQICDALECAHKNKIIHRDIKSQNIMITSDGRIKVTDFGIARAADGATITNSDNVFGSVQYFSPEQAKSDIVDERSDLYSLGIVLYEAFTGQLPFNGQTPVAIALKQIQERPALISDTIPGFPEELEMIVQKCLAKSPGDRYQNAKILKNDLMRALTDEEVINFKHSDNIEHTMVMNNFKNNLSTSNSKPIRKKPKNIAKGLAIAVSLVVLFGVFSYLGAALARKYIDVPEVIVPNVIGWQEEDAVKELEKLNLKPNIAERVFDKAPAGQVIDQDPKGDQKVKTTHPSIDLVVSKGPKAATVPNIVGKTEAEGIALLNSYGLEPGRIIPENSPDVPEGIIIDQNPREGFTLSEGESVNFTVSIGPETTNAPNLVGKTLDEAQALLKEKNITVSSVSKKPDQAPENTVIEQNPKPNEAMELNGSISIVISSGPVQLKEISVGPILLSSESPETTVKIVVSDDLGKNRTVYLKNHTPEDSPLNVPIEGAGEMEIEVWLDDVLYFKGER